VEPDLPGDDPVPLVREATSIAERLLAESDPATSSVGLVAASAAKLDPAACATVADLAASPGPLQAEAGRRLHGFSYARSYTAKVGETPSVFFAIRSMLAAASAKAKTEGGRLLIAKLELSLERTIEDHSNQEAVFLDPR
jgi:hypothetical protein